METKDKIELFKSVFKGRDDVFALRWEKGSKSGYMPAYLYDRYHYQRHKMKGGTFQNYSDKTYLPLSDEQISKHLEGQHLMGLYPLLKDNTSWFIAADFDEENWMEECKKFIAVCAEKNIPAYLERSRSGNGGHVWIFFERSYPAIRSRKIITSLLQQEGIFSVFDKSSSFDRLFPNQDFLSGKGFGNLIALPFHKLSLENGNSCFIDPDTFQPVKDQWQVLKTIKRISIAELDNLYSLISHGKTDQETEILPGKLLIKLSNTVTINRAGLPITLINFLKEELNYSNSEFIIKKKIGKNTWGTNRYFRFIEETEKDVIVPRGMIGKLLRLCKENNIDFDFKDEREKKKSVSFNFNIQLREHQVAALNGSSKKDFGVIVAPPGSGKTVIGLKIIADKQQPALIIVHRKQLAEQWTERIETFLGISKNEIGKIGQGKTKIGKQVTVAMIQSLDKAISKDEDILSAFGTILIDECHHIPAETFRSAINKLNAYYCYGLTATPFRKYNDGKIIFIHLGEIISEVKQQEIPGHGRTKIIIRNTQLDVPYNSKTDKFETLSKILVHDSGRNKLILDDVLDELKKGKRVVLLTERKEHIDSLYQFLKQSYETITLSGDDSEASRKMKSQQLHAGNFQALITTGQFFGEGTDLNNIQCLFLVYPFSFEGKLIQYIGRVQRSEIAPTIYDYRDIKIDYLNKLFLKRNSYYRRLQKQNDLFDDVEPEFPSSDKAQFIKKQIKVPIDSLDFRYGSVVIKHFLQELNAEVEFDIENLNIRPEFEVLKSYFAKVLKSNQVTVFVEVEIENGKLISQLATSEDLAKINQEIIESVKFRFASKNFFGKTVMTNSEESLLDINQIQSDRKDKLVGTEKELLEEALKNKSIKHYNQLVYLSQKHNDTVMKIRFVLNPFSFVFLLSGSRQYHLVMETLDTEEATYVWHINKNELRSGLTKVESDLNIIRNSGRQIFLESSKENFSRILHDYSDSKKGFIIWKDALEERLI